MADPTAEPDRFDSLDGAFCLVTGGAGFIGSHLVDALRARGARVRVLDNYSTGFAHNLSHLDSDEAVEILRGDASDAATADKAVAGVDYVFHQAAMASVPRSIREPDLCHAWCTTSTVQLLRAASQANVKRLVLASTSAAYGDSPFVSKREVDPSAPLSPYAAAKLASEAYCQAFVRSFPIEAVILRYFNAAGASFDGRIGEDWTYSQSLIPLAMKAVLLKDRRLSVFGDDYDTPDGTCIRDYIHVDDLADAHVKALEYLAGDGATTAVNVGTGVGSSVYDVLNATAEVAGEQVPYDVAPRRAGDPVATFADPTFAEQTLGWTARYGLCEIVETAFAWHTSQVGDAG